MLSCGRRETCCHAADGRHVVMRPPGKMLSCGRRERCHAAAARHVVMRPPGEMLSCGRREKGVAGVSGFSCWVCLNVA